MWASERDAAKRASWRAEMAGVNLADLVFVAESGTNLAMTPRYGRAPQGQRVVGVVPRNHGPNTTLIAAMGTAGIVAAMTVEGTMDRDAFDVFVVEGQVPRLRPGQTVIWDNLSVHTSAKAIAQIEAAGCRVVFLPPYSPDFAPIEQAFGKLKTFPRRAGARSRAALDDAMTAGLATITAADARAWFIHRGYACPQLL